MTDPAPVIRLCQVGGEYRVTVEPAQRGDCWDRTFPEYKQARPWARGARLARGWKLVDAVESKP